MMNIRPIFVGLGEALWDLLPSGKLLGGAPANFAYHANALGAEGVVASRIGADPLGNELAESLSAQGLGSSHIQRDPIKPTGTVDVQVSSEGQPTYDIVENVAWDGLAWTPEWLDLAGRCAVVCFGTLAQRDPASRATIREFLRACPADALRLLDINLRGDFFSREVIEQSLGLARAAKLNDEELPRVARLLGLNPGAAQLEIARRLRAQFDLDFVCVTRGSEGSLLVGRGETAEHGGFKAEVADTIGAGDSFTAALAWHLHAGASLDVANCAANRLGSYVAGRPGAMPHLPAEIINEVKTVEA